MDSFHTLHSHSFSAFTLNLIYLRNFSIINTLTSILRTIKNTLVKKKEETLVEAAPVHSGMFFNYNENLVPPYQVIVDTNFVNSSIQNKLDLHKGMLDCLIAKCIICVTDCVVGELEKLGHRYRMALQLVKDPRVKRLTCTHTGTYADDCIVERITMHKCYIVATNDKDLKRRIRKIPGVPIMYVANHKYAIERIPFSITSK